MNRLILEMGMGTDLHGSDYTRAARRAVRDALSRSSLNFVDGLGIARERLRVTVTVGTQSPQSVDTTAVASELPGAGAEVRSVLGGLDVAGASADDPCTVASAAVEVWLGPEG